MMVEENEKVLYKEDVDNKNITVVYFSGTGGTKRIADAFMETFLDSYRNVRKYSLDRSEIKKNREEIKNINNATDLVLLLYPVYAFDAPEPVYEWIELIPSSKGLKVAVISVSGAGDIWPNTSCRVKTNKLLQKKGYDIFFEEMMVMPCNWVVATNNHLALYLLKAVHTRVDQLTAKILSGERRTKERKSSRILYAISRAEKKGTKKFGQFLYALDTCNGCGLCEQNCPRNNILIQNTKPAFGEECIMCMRCIYECPRKSIQAKKYGFVALKNGFNLNKLEKSMQGVELEPIEKCSKGFIWKGVRKYLLDNKPHE